MPIGRRGRRRPGHRSALGARRRTVRRDARRAGRGRALQISARRHPLPPGSGVTVSTRRRPRPLGRHRSGALRVDGSGILRSRARRARLLRAPRRRVHAAGHVRGDHSAPGAAGRARRHRGRADADRRVPGLSQLGLRRRASVGAAIDLRRTARSAALRRRLSRARRLGLSRRRVQPPRSEGNYLSSSARTSPTARRPPGALR